MKTVGDFNEFMTRRGWTKRGIIESLPLRDQSFSKLSVAMYRNISSSSRLDPSELGSVLESTIGCLLARSFSVEGRRAVRIRDGWVEMILFHATDDGFALVIQCSHWAREFDSPRSRVPTEVAPYTGGYLTATGELGSKYYFDVSNVDERKEFDRQLSVLVGRAVDWFDSILEKKDLIAEINSAWIPGKDGDLSTKLGLRR